jgi:hypothetical protein
MLVLPELEEVVVVVMMVLDDVETVEVLDVVLDVEVEVVVVDDVLEEVVVEATETVKVAFALSAGTELTSPPKATTALAPLEEGIANVQENPPVEEVVSEVQV